MLNHFYNLSCYEEFEIQCALAGISKVDVLKIIGHQIDNYYFFVSNDGIFNWFDLEGNHVDDPGILKYIKEKYIPRTINKCIIPYSVTKIGYGSFAHCKSLKEITIPTSVTIIGKYAFYNCISLKEVIIPNSVTGIGNWAFSSCNSLKEIIFKGKTLDEVKQMWNYPFGIEDESIFKCEM